MKWVHKMAILLHMEKWGCKYSNMKNKINFKVNQCKFRDMWISEWSFLCTETNVHMKHIPPSLALGDYALYMKFKM